MNPLNPSVRPGTTAGAVRRRPEPFERVAWAVLAAIVVAAVVTAAWTAPLWAQILAGASVVVGWALARTRPADRSLPGHLADVVAVAILTAVGRILSGLALGAGVVLAVIALGSFAVDQLAGEVEHLVHDQAATTVQHAVQDTVRDAVPHPSLPSLSSVRDGMAHLFGGTR